MDDPYAKNMTRKGGEASRLDEQFELMTKNIGYLIHPSISKSLPEDVRVADVATGTGIFLEDFQAQAPRATLHGYDISPALFRNPGKPGIELSVLDAKTPVPKHLRGAYDLVHVRMLGAAMLPEEWAFTVKNVSQLLKPGGWLQWEECDFSNVRHVRGAEYTDSRVETARRMGRAFREALRVRFQSGWNTLPDDMRAAGLIDIETDCVSSDRLPETRERLTANGMQAIFSWARLMAEKGLLGTKTAQQLDQDEIEAFEDIRRGCYVLFEIYVACGRMPLV
ncbi:N-methyltransferase gliN [Paramyrothecium foliicola]|nr:N-methyltransferase gliN [Paramyrothecium foliicola]